MSVSSRSIAVAVLIEDLDRFLAVARFVDAVAGARERLREQLADGRLVLDEQNRLERGRRSVRHQAALRAATRVDATLSRFRYRRQGRPATCDRLDSRCAEPTQASTIERPCPQAYGAPA